MGSEMCIRDRDSIVYRCMSLSVFDVNRIFFRAYGSVELTFTCKRLCLEGLVVGDTDVNINSVGFDTISLRVGEVFDIEVGIKYLHHFKKSVYLSNLFIYDCSANSILMFMRYLQYLTKLSLNSFKDVLEFKIYGVEKEGMVVENSPYVRPDTLINVGGYFLKVISVRSIEGNDEKKFIKFNRGFDEVCPELISRGVTSFIVDIDVQLKQKLDKGVETDSFLNKLQIPSVTILLTDMSIPEHGCDFNFIDYGNATSGVVSLISYEISFIFRAWDKQFLISMLNCFLNYLKHGTRLYFNGIGYNIYYEKMMSLDAVMQGETFASVLQTEEIPFSSFGKRDKYTGGLLALNDFLDKFGVESHNFSKKV